MAQQILFLVHYAFLSLFGVVLSFAFAGVGLAKKKNILLLSGLYLACGVAQLGLFLWLGEALVWKIYPLIFHVPLVLTLWIFCKKQIVTGLAAVATAYMCCQPAKWMGLFCTALGGSYELEMIVRIVTMVAVGVVCVKWAAPCLSEIFNKNAGNVLIFGIVPMLNYLFDYGVGIYTDAWQTYAQVAGEFMPFFLCVVFMVFCMVYYKQYEQKTEAQRRERLISVQVQQQAAHMEKVRETEKVVYMVRHDMRHFLSGLAVCLENDDRQKALELVRSYLDYTDMATVKKYCDNDMVNYVLADISAKCKAEKVDLQCTVELGQVSVDEIMLCSILSNLLENAFIAQCAMSADQKRQIKLLLKSADGKLLISVKNPVDQVPNFEDDLPVSDRDGHGYGTQSVRYITQQLGGNCQFCVQNGIFIARVVI